MSFRWRVVLFTATAVAVAVLVASAIVYVLVRGQLRDRIDDELARDATVTFDLPILRRGALTPPEIGGAQRHGNEGGGGAAQAGGGEQLILPTGPLGGPSAYAQVIKADGEVVGPAGGGPRLPATEDAIAIAQGSRDAAFSEATLASGHVRVYTAPVEGGGGAIQVARSLDDVDETLEQLALILAAVSLGGIFAGALLGLLVSRTALSPVQRLSSAARDVATTRDLSRRIDPSGGHELAELATSFNRMLNALEGSLDSQRQLVADASHELRTPLASLRTNIEVLAHSDSMDRGSRERLLTDVIAQLDELTALVGDLVDLARDVELDEPAEELRLDHLVEDVVELARMRRPQARIELTAEPCSVRGDAHALTRAISNLLDNAVKWGPPGTPIDVVVGRDGVVGVRDHGPGIEDADLPRVFDRFYRSASSRGLPGSGLGLAIVRRVAERHHGTASAESPPGGGALLLLAIPPLPAPAQPEPREPQAFLT